MADCTVCEAVGRQRPAVIVGDGLDGQEAEMLCLPHAMQEDHPCVCGTPKWSDHLSGCGNWQPTSGRAKDLLQYIFDNISLV